MSLFNTLNNITTDKITINDEIVFKNNSITDLVLTGTSFTPSSDDTQKIPTVKFIEDFVDIQDNNYAKLNESNEFVASNTFDENATFNKNIIVAKNNESIVSSLTIDGNSIAVTDSDNNTNTIKIQNTTISTTESTTKDTLTTDNIVTDSIKIPNNSSYTITSITGSSESGRSNNSLPTKDYIDDKIATDLTNCAKKNEANTFENGYTQTFAGPVSISNTLTTSGTVNANNGITTSTGNLNLSSTGKTINLGNKESDPTTIITSSEATPTDTLTTDNLSLRSNLSVTGTSTLTGNTSITGTLTVGSTSTLTGNTTISGTLTVNNASTLAGNVTMGSKQSGQTTLTTTSGIDTFTTDKVIVGTVEMSNGSSGVYDITSIQGSATTGADNTKLTTKGYVDDITASLSNYAKLDDNNTFVANKTQTFSGPVITSDTLTANGGITTSSGNLNLTSTTKQINLVDNSNIKTTAVSGSSPTVYEDTLTTDNITLTKNLTVNGETILTSPVYFGSKSTGKSSLITDQNNYDKFTTDNIDVSQDLSVTGNTTLTGDLNVTGSTTLSDTVTINDTLTTTGDVYLGQKEENKTTIITTQIPGSSPAEYEDTLTTDNVVIRDSFTINGELEANLPQKYNYAYLYNETNHYYTYNNINYEYDTTNHNFKVIGFRNNKNNTFIIEPYLLIEESNELKKYPVIDVDSNFTYTTNNIDTYIYLPDIFDYIMCANLLNKITTSSASNIYISISFKYKMFINYKDNTNSPYFNPPIDTELNFTNKTIYYIIRNPNFEIDLYNDDLWKDSIYVINHNISQLGIIIPNSSLYIINLANINNCYLGLYSFNGTECIDYHLTSNIELLKDKIIEQHYNMYLLMRNNKNNYLQKSKDNNLLYIKQYNTFNEGIESELSYIYNILDSDPEYDNDTKPYAQEGKVVESLSKIYYMTNYSFINWIKYNNNTHKLQVYIDSIYNNKNYNFKYSTGYMTYFKLICDYTNYSISELIQGYFIDNMIYLLFSTTNQYERLLFIFDVYDFTYYKVYVYQSESETTINNLIFHYNKNDDVYILYTMEIDNNSQTDRTHYFKRLILNDNSNNQHLGTFKIDDGIAIDLVLSNTIDIIDVCYSKPYIILLTKTNSSYNLYYCSDIFKNYWQILNITLPTLSSGEYKFYGEKYTFGYIFGSQPYVYKYCDHIYIANINNTYLYKGAQFSFYSIDELLMRI